MDNNLNPFSKLVNQDLALRLLDKIESAIGWVINNSSKHQAQEIIYNEVSNSNLPLEEKIALISSRNQIIKQYKNQESIIKCALQHLRDEAKPEDIDDMWIMYYMDKGRLISDEEFQKIWGLVLAEECNKPGSVPRSLLITLEQMDKEDAESFLKFCSYTVELKTENDNGIYPVIFDVNDEKNFIDLELLLRIKRLNLIDWDFAKSNPFYVHFELDSVQAVYFDEKYEFSKGVNNIPIGTVVFTKSGSVLRKLVSPSKIPGYLNNTCIPMWKNELNNKSSAQGRARCPVTENAISDDN